MNIKIRKVIRLFHREFDAFWGLILGGKSIRSTRNQPQDSKLIISNFKDFAYSKKSHFSKFLPISIYKRQNLKTCDLKVYQDLFMYTFIVNNIKKGSRLLEIGGGESRIILLLKQSYEIWNLDKLEGQGFGPKRLMDTSEFKLIKDFIGSFNKEIPDNYFDLVFSISTIEHIPDDENTVVNVLEDIQRILKPGGYSIHCIDAFLFPDRFYVHPLVQKVLNEKKSFNDTLDFNLISTDLDLWVLPKFAYYTRWYHLTRQSINDLGHPFSINVLWQEELN